MYGQITKFHREIGAGIIRAEDGRTFRFASSELLSGDETRIGDGVDFELADRRPQHIIVLNGSPWTAFGAIKPN